MSEITIPNSIIDIVLNGRKSQNQPDLKPLTNYIRNEIQYVRSGFCTNYGLNQIYITIHDVINHYKLYINDNDDAYPINSIILESGVELRNDLIMVIKRAGLYSPTHTNGFKNQVQQIINHINPEQLYVTNLSDPLDVIHLASLSDMLDYLQTINKVLSSFYKSKQSVIKLVKQINPLIPKYFYM